MSFKKVFIIESDHEILNAEHISNAIDVADTSLINSIEEVKENIYTDEDLDIDLGWFEGLGVDADTARDYIDTMLKNRRVE